MSANVYSLPYPRHLKGLAFSDPRIHRGPYKHAIDFILPFGTSVFASANGIVEELKHDSSAGGSELKYAAPRYLNYIVVRHARGERTVYGHLAQNSGRIVVGQAVKRGQVIAHTGVSGLMTLPHLHFHVFIVSSYDTPMTIPITFCSNVTIRRPRTDSERHSDVVDFVANLDYTVFHSKPSQ